MPHVSILINLNRIMWSEKDKLQINIHVYIM